MRVLLDTHTLLWWLTDDRRLSRRARAVIAKASNEVFVSAVSALEVTTKHRIGKLEDAGPLAVDFTREVLAAGMRPLPITLEHGQVAGALPGPHRDPFDRLLVAQSREEKLALVSNDEVFDSYGVVRVW